MITFKQYLKEAERDVDDLKTLLNDDAGEFLHMSGGHYLIRAMKVAKGQRRYVQDPYDKENILEYYVIRPRMNRQPTDTSQQVHEFLDDWFNDHFGFRARSQAVFAFGQKVKQGDIDNYGKPYMIFPVGDFDYVWSPTVEDLYAQTIGMKLEIDFRMTDWESAYDEFLTNNGYQKKSLEKAVLSRNEVMVKCDFYYAFPMEYKDTINKMLSSL